jgi:regulator of nucleoside diphosphate kinase
MQIRSNTTNSVGQIASFRGKAMSVSIGDICVTRHDYERIIKLIEDPLSQKSLALIKESFIKDLKKARKVDPEKIPADCITMNSTFTLTDIGTSQKMTITLVFPKDENIKKGKVSVLSPEGSAVLGVRVGSVIKWKSAQSEKYYQVSKILFQPESSGQFNL